MVLTGPDVSHHQGSVSWASVRSAGHTFAWLKASEGSTFKDSRYQGNAAGVRANGMTLGAYHFLRTGSGEVQARHYLNVIGSPAGMMCCLDVETAGDGSKPGIADVREFAAEFHWRTGGHPLVIYTGRWYWHGTIGNPYGADLGPLWHSEYDGTNPFDADVANGPEGDTYGGWASALFWQHTSSGSCPGISGRCDLNLFYGSQGDLLALTHPPSATPTPPPEEDEMITVIAGATDQAPRYWAALMDGYVRIFNLWTPEGLDDRTEWCPNEEYERGVGTLYKPVKRVDDRTYDVLVASAKRSPYDV